MPIKAGDKILAYHGTLIYEAHVLATRVNPETSETEYNVHYHGWGDRWDEWIGGARVLEHTDANVTLMRTVKETNDKVKVEAKRIKRAKRAVLKETMSSKRSKKNREEATLTDEPLAFDLDPMLRKVLVDDWVNVTQKPTKLAILPAAPTVHAILNQFACAEAAQPLPKGDIPYDAFAVGLCALFNASLETALLYPQEHKVVARAPPGDAADVYGGRHLLRLLIKLPALLAKEETLMREFGPRQHTEFDRRFAALQAFLTKHRDEVFPAAAYVTVKL